MGIVSKLLESLTSFRPQENHDSIEVESSNLIDAFKAKYNLSDVQSIRSIPISEAKKWDGNEPSVKVLPEYILQRMATEHKKAGRMDLAIECLYKANELMPHSYIAWPAKDYYRLASYLDTAGKTKEADVVRNKLDKKFGNSSGVIQQEQFAQKARRTAEQFSDLVEITFVEGCCGECAKYRGRIFSLSGKSKKYPRYPDWFIQHPGHCGHTEFAFIDGGIAVYAKGDPVKWSCRPFIDDRTDTEKMTYNKRHAEEIRILENEHSFAWLMRNIPDQAPKSLSGYSRMRSANSEKFKLLKAKAAEHGFDLEHGELFP